MADVETEDRGTALLPGVHRVVRTLDPTEGPFAGTLVTRGDAVAVRVDAVSLAGWAGWRFAGAEHVAGPVDVIRRSDGHDVLLPWCTDRVLGFLVRRTAADSALSPGECCTLLVSMLRGLDELGEAADAVQTGVWWLTDGGRPTFILGEGDDPRAGVAEIVEHLREDCIDKALGRLLATIGEGLVRGLVQPRVARRLLEEWEKELLAIAAPRPLGRELHPPERARDIARALAPAAGRSAQPRASRREHRVSSVPRRDGPSVVTVMDRVRSALALARGAVAERSEVKGARRRKTVTPAARVRRVSGRRPVLIFAGSAAIAVLAVGFLWPAGGPAESSDAAHAGSPSSKPSGAGAQAASADGEPEAADREAATATPAPTAETASPADVAAALLISIGECHAAGDLVCAKSVAAGSAGVVELLAPAAEGSPSLELVDEYGDVAVVRLAAPVPPSSGEGESQAAAPDRMLVLVRQNERWLVRDVYGVADQPG